MLQQLARGQGKGKQSVRVEQGKENKREERRRKNKGKANK